MRPIGRLFSALLAIATLISLCGGVAGAPPCEDQDIVVMKQAFLHDVDLSGGVVTFTTDADLFAKSTADLYLYSERPLSACDDAGDCGRAIQAACRAIGSTARIVTVDLQAKTCEGECANGVIATAICVNPRPSDDNSYYLRLDPAQGNIIFYEN